MAEQVLQFFREYGIRARLDSTGRYLVSTGYSDTLVRQYGSVRQVGTRWPEYVDTTGSLFRFKLLTHRVGQKEPVVHVQVVRPDGEAFEEPLTVEQLRQRIQVGRWHALRRRVIKLVRRR